MHLSKMSLLCVSRRLKISKMIRPRHLGPIQIIFEPVSWLKLKIESTVD